MADVKRPVSATTLARIDALAWTLVYLGLFLAILGLATGATHRTAAWSLGVAGTVLAIAGVVLIAVRSRLPDQPANPPTPEPSSRGTP